MDKYGYTPKVFIDLFSGNGIRQRGMISLERLGEAILQDFESVVYKGLEHYRPRKFGLVHSRKGQVNVIREIFKPGSTGDKDAADMAKAIRIGLERLKKQFNNAGGHITELEDYMLPQFHDPTRIGRASRDDWVAFVKDKIDLNRLIYHGAPGAVVSDAQATKLLKRVYDNIKSRGAINGDISVSPHIRKMIGNHHQEHRILHFKDADAWVEYADKFGAIDYVQSVHSHAEMMSKEIAVMEMFGPNPDHMVRYLRKKVQEHLGDPDVGSWGESTYNLVMGRNHIGNRKIAEVMRSIRNISTGLKIGKAVISAVSDTYFTAITSHLNGLPVMKTFSHVMSGLVNNKANRMLAAHLHLGARYAIDNAKSAYRISEVIGVGGSAKFADFVVRASGLNFWTNTVRQSFGLSALHHLGTLTDRSYVNLNPKIRGMFKRYGITSLDWDKMRHAQVLETGGTRYLDPDNFGDTDLVHKLMGAIGEETHFAVPEPNAKVMAFMRADSKPGTLPGEAVRAFGTFKSFAATVAISQWARALNKDGFKPGAMYLVSLLTGTTALGAIALQAKSFVDGKSPHDMDSGNFWASAFLQGGGTGILGDFLFQDHTRMGSVAEFLGGPLATDSSTLLGLVFGTGSDFNQARDNIMTKASKRTARAIDRLMPNLWQTNLLMRRYLTDHVQQMLNPHWATEQRTARRRMKKSTGREFLWRPGELTPEFMQ
jgi:hypothetical protein